MIAGYPGSFDPPTHAHLAVAEAALRTTGAERIDFVLSARALGKHSSARTPVAVRAEVLRLVASTRPWLGVAVTEAQLITDIAASYDAVVMGADKWEQVVDPAWYDDSPANRDAAVARLPKILVAPRSGYDPAAAAARITLPVAVTTLDLPTGLADVSSTLARSGRHHLMLPEAAASGYWT